MENNVLNELIAINEANYTGNWLLFDDKTGDLKVIKKSDYKGWDKDSMSYPCGLVVTELAEDGFM
jgi:hypothetical protein